MLELLYFSKYINTYKKLNHTIHTNLHRAFLVKPFEGSTLRLSEKTNKRDNNLFFIIQIQNSKTHLPRNLIRIDIPRVPSSSLEVPELARRLLTRGTVDTA